VQDGAEKLVRLLLDRGADAAAADGDGDTPLMKAAGVGEAGVVKLLLQRGAAADCRNARGETAAMRAAEKDEGAECLRALVAARADLEARDEEVHTDIPDNRQ
jgi:ankyrin repeat protein